MTDSVRSRMARRQDATYFATIRLDDSLTSSELRTWHEATMESLRECGNAPTDTDRRHALRRAHGRLEKMLDLGHGTCALSSPDVASNVMDALLAFDGDVYTVHSWVVMPNHAHALLTLPPDESIRRVLNGWRASASGRIHRCLNGVLSWHPEDLIEPVNGPGRFRQFHEYIHKNPGRGGLVNWPWVGGDGVPPISVLERWGEPGFDD